MTEIPNTGLKPGTNARQNAGDLRLKKVLEGWVGKVLEPRGFTIQDLFEDLKDGFVLYNLCEVLSKTELKKYGKMSSGKMRIQLVANQNVVFKFLRSRDGIRLLFVGPSDVVDGNPKLVLGLMWSIMAYFTIADALGQDSDADEDKSSVDVKVRTRLIHWLLRYTSPPEGVSGEPILIEDLASSLQNGAVFLALLHHFDPENSLPHSERMTGISSQDLALALEELAKLHGADNLLDPSAKLDECFTVPYLVHVVALMHAKFGSDSCLPLSDASLDAPPNSVLQTSKMAREAADVEAEKVRAAKELELQDLAALHAKVKQLELANAHLTEALVLSKEEAASSARAAAVAEALASASQLAERSNSKLDKDDSSSKADTSGDIAESEVASLVAAAKDAFEAAAKEHADEIASQHTVQVQHLETRVLDLEKERIIDASRHADKVADLAAALAAARAVASSAEAAVAAAEAKELMSRETLVAKVRDQDAERRKLHNTIQELRGNVRVFARVRPFLPHELEAPRANDDEAWLRCDPDGCSIHAMARLFDSNHEDSKTDLEVTHSFTYDRTFGVQDDQAAVFAEVSEFVQSALDGYNVCLFSYGQTGSGKTYTMTGEVSSAERGIIPRAIEQVALRKAQLEEAGWAFEMKVSFVEIYCEAIKDLLSPSSSSPLSVSSGHAAKTSNQDSEPAGNSKKKFKIVANEFGQNIITGVETVPVDPADKKSIDELMMHAASLRSTSATLMNAESSRSHSVFTLHMTATHSKQGVTLHGQLDLVDLAGSERVEKSGVTGQALTEAKHINTSLSALSGVFLALGKKASHVPFRDSKLTELLHPALSANGKTLMLLNLSPLESSVAESVSSLRFGTSVNSCELGKAKRVIKRAFEPNAAVSSKVMASINKGSPPRDARLPVLSRERSPAREAAAAARASSLPPRARSGSILAKSLGKSTSKLSEPSSVQGNARSSSAVAVSGRGSGSAGRRPLQSIPSE